MRYYTDEELLNMDFDDFEEKPEPLIDGMEELMAVLELDHSQDPPRPDPIPPYAREAMEEEYEPETVKPKKEKRVLTPEEKQVRALSAFAWIQGIALAALAVGSFLWTR